LTVLLGEEELLADLAVGHALGDEVEDASFPGGEPGERVGFGGAPQPFEDPAGQRRVEERLTAGDEYRGDHRTAGNGPPWPDVTEQLI
jgi:hypothetical protein